MQYSIVNFNVVDLGNRIDAEYFSPRYLKEDSLLAKYSQRNIGDFAFVTDGQHGYHEVDNDSPISHLTAKNAKNWFANLEGADRIAKWVDDKNKRSSLVEGDLILSTRGTVGFCALVMQEVLPANIDQDVARIAIDENVVIPEYVLSYLNCKFGQDWLQRNTSGMVQQGLSLQKVRLLPVPILDVQFQKYIKHTINVAYNTQTEAKLNYERAQTLILSELGLLDWKPKHSLSFVKNYSDTKRAGRCDAEYFQPKYTEILEIIEKNSQYTCRISSIQNYNARGLQPAYNPDGTLNVISSRHILETDLDYDKFERTNCSNWTDQRRARVYKGDILTYTTGANIGRTAVYNSNIPALASNHVNILRIDNENPEYIGFVMNSIIGRLQTERLSAGSAQAELYPKDIENFVIPFIALDKQNEVIGKIIQSRLMKHKSKYILESAKKAVEMAIEKDEKTAMQWLKNQIDNTGRDN